MSDELYLEDPRTGTVKHVHAGFDWILFLFAGVFGIPLFWRGMHYWGVAFVALWVVDIALVFLVSSMQWSLIAQAIVTLIFFALQLWLGFYGRELTVEAYIARGWRKRDRAPRPRPARKRRP